MSSIFCFALLLLTQPAAQQKTDPLTYYHGAWEISSAVFQLGGRTSYYFFDDKLIVSQFHSGGKAGPRVPEKLSSQRVYQISVSKQGDFLKLTPFPEPRVNKDIIYRVDSDVKGLHFFVGRDYELSHFSLRRVKMP